MSEKAEVEAIIANLELEDYFVVHGVQNVWSNGKRSRVYAGQDKKHGNEAYKYTEDKGYRKMVSILVEVREE